MTKKYRLKVPDMIKREDAEIASRLNCLDETDFTVIDTSLGFQDIPKDWLEEIKKPMSPEKWVEDRFDIGYKCELRSEYIETFKAGEENNELKHIEQKTVVEWWENYGNGDPGPGCETYDGNWVRTAIFNCWRACKKSHSLKD